MVRAGSQPVLGSVTNREAYCKEAGPGDPGPIPSPAGWQTLPFFLFTRFPRQSRNGSGSVKLGAAFRLRSRPNFVSVRISHFLRGNTVDSTSLSILHRHY